MSTIRSILFEAAKTLKYSSSSPELDSEILLCHILKKGREYLFTYPEKKLTPVQISLYKKIIQKRLKYWPIAYLVGKKEFFGLNFFVQPKILIPRPETELLVEEALNQIANIKSKDSDSPLFIIDIGTGSGAIIISLAKMCSVDSTNCIKFFASDISEDPIKTAKKNERILLKRKLVDFMQGDLLEPWLEKFSKIRKNKNFNALILANLPYLTNDQIICSPSIQKEPKLALYGGKDGLKYYRQIFNQASKLAKFTNVKKCYIIGEIDPSQKNALKNIAQKKAMSKIKYVQDISNKTRIFSAQIA